MLQALTRAALGDRHEALVALGRALVDAPEPDAYVRLYLEEGAPMLALLHDAAEDGTPAGEDARAAARRLLDRSGMPARDAGAPQTLADPLSARELEVLRLLDSELTGPEIARQLFVSLNTLRSHSKRIFTKLDVKTRGGRRTPGPRAGAPLARRGYRDHEAEHTSQR